MVIDWSLDEVTPEYFAEIDERRGRELGIKEKYVRKSLQFLIGESVKKIAKYDQQLRQIEDENDPKRLSLQGNRAQEEARKAELFAPAQGPAGRDRAGTAPVGEAARSPGRGGDPAAAQGSRRRRSRAWRAIPRSRPSPSSSSRSTRSSQGRKPVSVEEENCGWDITSLLGGQMDRYIEVKGRAGVGGVALTPNEWIKAQRFGKDYWLYVVVNCKTKPELYLIQDPASKLKPKEEVSVVRYMVGQQDWQKAASKE